MDCMALALEALAHQRGQYVDKKETVSVGRAAAVANCSESAIRIAIRKGYITAWMDGRVWVVLLSSVEAYAKPRPIGRTRKGYQQC